MSPLSGAGARSGFLALLLTLSVAPGIQAQTVHTEAGVAAAVRSHNLGALAARTGALADAERPGQVRPASPMLEAMLMPRATLSGEPGIQLMGRQPLTWRDRLRADRNARAAMADAATLEAEMLVREQVAAAREAYAELWSLQEQAALIAAYVTDLNLYREAALAQYRTSRGPQGAVLGIEVDAEMRAQRLEALSESGALYRARIRALTGGEVRIAPGDRLAPPASTADAVTSAALDAHPRVAAGEAMERAEREMERMNRTMLRPEWTVGAVLNLSSMAFRGEFGQEVLAPTVGVMVPLWRSGIRAQVRESALRAEQRALETRHARLELGAEYEDATDQLARVRARIERYESRLRPRVRQSLEATLSGYSSGMMRFLELLEARRMALDVELDLVMARAQEAMLVARLDALGGSAEF